MHKHYLLLLLLVLFLNLLASQLILEVDLSNFLQAQQGEAYTKANTTQGTGSVVLCAEHAWYQPRLQRLLALEV